MVAGNMSSDMQRLAQQAALFGVGINGNPVTPPATAPVNTQANYGGALPQGLDRVVAGPNGGQFALGSGNVHSSGYEIPNDPRGAEDFSVARAVAYQNDPSRYDSRWGGAAWTGDDTWLTSPGGATFARSDLLNPDLTDSDIIARTRQYATGALTPTAAVKGATGEGTPLYYFNSPSALQQKSTEDEAATRQAAAIRGEVDANNATLVPQLQREAGERIRNSLPDVTGLLPNRNLDGSINYDWMVQWATGKATKPAWYDQYVGAWNSAAQQFGTQQAPAAAAQPLSPQAATTPAPQGLPPASAPGAAAAAPLGTPPAPLATSDLGGRQFNTYAGDFSTYGREGNTGHTFFSDPAPTGTPNNGLPPAPTTSFAFFDNSAPGATERAANTFTGDFSTYGQAPATTAFLPPTTFPGYVDPAAQGIPTTSPTLPNLTGMANDALDSASRSVSSIVGNATGGDIGGMIGSLVPVVGAGLVGRGIGAAVDTVQANNQLSNVGLSPNLGVADWAKSVLPQFMGGTPTTESLANSVYNQGYAGTYTPQGLTGAAPLGTVPGSTGTLLQTVYSPNISRPSFDAGAMHLPAPTLGDIGAALPNIGSFGNFGGFSMPDMSSINAMFSSMSDGDSGLY